MLSLNSSTKCTFVTHLRNQSIAALDMLKSALHLEYFILLFHKTGFQLLCTAVWLMVHPQLLIVQRGWLINQKSIKLLKWKCCTNLNSTQIILIRTVVMKHVLSTENTLSSFLSASLVERPQKHNSGRNLLSEWEDRTILVPCGLKISSSEAQYHPLCTTNAIWRVLGKQEFSTLRQAYWYQLSHWLLTTAS